MRSPAPKRRGSPAAPPSNAKVRLAPSQRPRPAALVGTGTTVLAPPTGPLAPAEPPPAPAPARATSALDAAARVLAETGRPMSCKELIEAMAQQGYWASPAGKTPWATLYASVLRELCRKGEQARFTKVAAGRFALRQPSA